MNATEPATALDSRYSVEDAVPTGWPEARNRLEQAEVFWLSTVRPDGRPHVTPLIAVWADDALHFCTGPDEAKYGPDWHFTVRDGAFHHDPGTALVYEVAPSTAFGFRKGAYSQTRWHFGRD
jgi:hypothetical protein